MDIYLFKKSAHRLKSNKSIKDAVVVGHTHTQKPFTSHNASTETDVVYLRKKFLIYT